MPTPNRPMMWHGVFLFLIGLVTGLQERRFKNMRMALSAHRLFDPRRRGAIPQGLGRRSVQDSSVASRIRRWRVCNSVERIGF
jgi:hydroxylaminobenzene mutase